jgi:hypothetical protein
MVDEYGESLGDDWQGNTGVLRVKPDLVPHTGSGKVPEIECRP